MRLGFVKCKISFDDFFVHPTREIETNNLVKLLFIHLILLSPRLFCILSEIKPKATVLADQAIAKPTPHNSALGANCI
jgi:hypothetical protein